MTVAAGSKIGFASNTKITHIGAIEWYMTKVPEGHTVATWDGSGEVWLRSMRIIRFLGGLLCSGLVLVC
jgi:hypothetical protein